MPLFSVIIPAYNVADCIASTLRSVFSQTVHDIEILVVDDGSTDGTPDVLRQQTDPRMRVITQSNQGVSAARNRALSEAKGEFVAFLDGDDLWAADHLGIALNFFRKHPEINWHASSWRSGNMEERLLPVKSRDGDRSYILNYYVSGSFNIWTSALCFRKNAFPHGFAFPCGLKYAEDTTAWMHFASANPYLGKSFSVTAMYRMRPDSATHRRKWPLEFFLENRYRAMDAMAHFPYPQAAAVTSRTHQHVIYTERWHNILECSRLKGFGRLLMHYRRQTGCVTTLYVASYLLLHHALSLLFLLPLRVFFWMYVRIVPRLNK